MGLDLLPDIPALRWLALPGCSPPQERSGSWTQPSLVGCVVGARFSGPFGQQSHVPRPVRPACGSLLAVWDQLRTQGLAVMAPCTTPSVPFKRHNFWFGRDTAPSFPEHACGHGPFLFLCFCVFGVVLLHFCTLPVSAIPTFTHSYTSQKHSTDFPGKTHKKL